LKADHDYPYINAESGKCIKSSAKGIAKTEEGEGFFIQSGNITSMKQALSKGPVGIGVDADTVAF